MNYTIHITGKAVRDLNDAVDYIDYNLLNPLAADRLLEKTEAEINKLATMPKRHKIVDDPVLAAWGIRFIRIDNYLAFYVVDEQNKIVHLVRFLYGKRDWISILRAEEERSKI